MLLLDNLRHDIESELVEGCRDGYVPAGREGTAMCAVAMNLAIACGHPVEAVLDLRMEAGAVADGVARIPAQDLAHVVAVQQE